MQYANDNHAGIRVLDLFSAAAGGWSLGMHRAGYRTIAACEVIDWRRTLYSQNNPGVPVYDDVTILTADRLIRDGVGLPDIIVGSPPCQDISSANTKGKGVDGARSSLYFEAVRLIDECRPRWFALENSANLRIRGADRVIDALAAIGYTCWPFVVSAGDIGANHERKRSWLIGFKISDANGSGWWAGKWWGIGRDIRNEKSSNGIELVGDTQGFRRNSRTRDNQSSEGEIYRHVASDSDGNGLSNTWVDADASEAGRGARKGGVECLEASTRQTIGRAHAPGYARVGDRLPGPEQGQVGGSEGEGVGQSLTEPWSDWNSGLAHHLRVDDGLSCWVAQSRIAIGGPRGTVAASLIVEAFGDAVCPQIPEAIGRAIIRVERAICAISQNDNSIELNQKRAA